MKVIKYYPYREARVPVGAIAVYWDANGWETGSPYEEDINRAIVDRRLMRKLEEELTKLAGRRMPDNHVTIVYEDDAGVERAAWFHDNNAYLGFPEDVELSRC